MGRHSGADLGYMIIASVCSKLMSEELSLSLFLMSIQASPSGGGFEMRVTFKWSRILLHRYLS